MTQEEFGRRQCAGGVLRELAGTCVRAVAVVAVMAGAEVDVLYAGPVKFTGRVRAIKARGSGRWNGGAGVDGECVCRLDGAAEAVS